VVLFGVIFGYAFAGVYLGAGSMALFSLPWWQEAFRLVGDAADGNLGVYLLLGTAVAGSLSAAALTLSQRILSAKATTLAWWSGVKAVLPTLIILGLAISIRSAVEAVHADWFLASLLGPTDPLILPIAVFLLAAVTAFSTGTSWGTMSILMSVVIPLVAEQIIGLSPSEGALIMALCLSAVLDGAIFGDHCSPISDTTVMSSMASACDHIDHVRTQLPYALVVMVTAGLAGYILVGATAVSAWVAYGVGALLLAAWLLVVGKRVA
jgi:Na+/H+ antiporter NhaC